MEPPNDAIRFCCSVDNTFEIAAPVLAEYMQIGWSFLLSPIRMFWGVLRFLFSAEKF